jgi:hypothetical protein
MPFLLDDTSKDRIFNGRELEVNRALDGNTYPGKKLVPYSLSKKLVVKKCKNLDLGLVMPSNG